MCVCIIVKNVFLCVLEDKKLFTPGPLGTSLTVKEAMLRDVGSRDVQFVETVSFIRQELLKLAGVSTDDYTTVPVQGSGTFAVEAVIQTTVPRQNGKVLVLENGAYGKRMGKICETLSIPYQLESFPENEAVNVSRIEEILKKDNSFNLICIVHCETSSGVFNPVEQVGKLVNQLSPKTSYFVDGMSSFGAVPLDLYKSHVDYLVSSANKCIQGTPGFSFAIAKRQKLFACKGNSRSLSLDLVDQCDNLDKTGQFRFTPATHAMLAFRQALCELHTEGGVEGRAQRYQANRKIVQDGMKKLGFKELLDDKISGYIITSFLFPKHPNFNFKEFYSRLNEKDQVIYPGKVLDTDCFRIGNIGHLFPQDMHKLLECVEQVCKDMKLELK
ncbi:hypothetical protein LOTGIDRAFT_110620 [Lottia gigantea]|uniref:Alanine--glyoxylate aminotransferase n=1 Tax=Lottia gigantea TaxID=225164 RepID=V4B613_LOTGI|nr:hypothetical protein LOTGIDRAFT_110620 [Lottia gigantea]ESP02956.1 hypothetical protein LOTGIDRAFT_110620 [Lottia gigantea]